MANDPLYADPNPGTTRSLTVDATLNDAASRNSINQIRGQSLKGSVTTGIPKQVTNVGAQIATGSEGTTSTVRVTFHRDPSDKNYSHAAVWVKGYQGNNNPVLQASANESPATFVINNTGEPIGIIVQAVGNSGQAPLSSSPTTGLRLPKSTVSGYGTSTAVGYTPASPPPSGVSFDVAGQGWLIGPGIRDISCTIAGFDAAITNYAANVVVVQQFQLDSPWTLSAVSYKLNAGLAGSHFNFGIYDASKTKLIDSAAFDGSIVTVQTKTFTPVTLPGGTYYFACSATSATPTGASIQVGAVVISDFLKIITNVNPLIATAANATSSNVLPTTLGALTAVTSASFQGLPLCVWTV